MRVNSAEGFGGVQNHQGVLAVANSVLAVVETIIPGRPPFGDRPIHILYSNEQRVLWGLTDYTAANYRINLSSQAAYWYQMAYQLSHELAHVKMGPARSNLLLEVLAVAVSLESLIRIRHEWIACPPFPWDGWAEYAEQIVQYRLSNVQSGLKRLWGCIDAKFLLLPFDQQIDKLIKTKPQILSLPIWNEQSRAWQVVAADMLIRNTLYVPERWADLLSLAINTNPPAMQELSYREDLEINSDSLPTWLPDWLR